MDKIIIDDIISYAYHGVLPEERELGQEFQISLELGADFSVIKDDQIEQAVDYRHAVEVVQKIMKGPSCHLLETLAVRIANQLLLVPGVMEVEVEVRKPNPPLAAVSGGTGVIVTRRNP